MLSAVGPVPTHNLLVLLGSSRRGLWSPPRRAGGRPTERVACVVLGALVGGTVFMRLGTWLQRVHLRQNAGAVEQWQQGNRPVLGGLGGAWLCVHVLKRLVATAAAPGT